MHGGLVHGLVRLGALVHQDAVRLHRSAAGTAAPATAPSVRRPWRCAWPQRSAAGCRPGTAHRPPCARVRSLRLVQSVASSRAVPAFAAASKLAKAISVSPPNALVGSVLCQTGSAPQSMRSPERTGWRIRSSMRWAAASSASPGVANSQAPPVASASDRSTASAGEVPTPIANTRCPLARAASIISLRLPDLPVGDHQHVGAFASLEEAGSPNTARSAACISVPPMLASIRGNRRHQRMLSAPAVGDRRQNVLDVAAKAAEADLVARAQPVDHAAQCGPGRRDAVAAHRARAVHQQLERDVVALSDKGRLQRCHAHHGVRHRILCLHQQRRLGFGWLDQDHHVAVEPGALGQRQLHRRQASTRARSGVSGIRSMPPDSAPATVTDSVSGYSRSDGRLRHLLRLQPRTLGIAVARCDRRRNRQAQPALLERQHLRKAQLEHQFVAGLQVADVGGVQSVVQPLPASPAHRPRPGPSRTAARPAAWRPPCPSMRSPFSSEAKPSSTAWCGSGKV